MLRTLLYRGPEDALVDCWTVVDGTSAVHGAITAVARTSSVASPTARVAELSVAADYMRWVDAERGLDDSGAIVVSGLRRALSA